MKLLNKFSKREKTIAYVVVIAISLLVSVRLIVSPIKTKLKEIDKEIETTRKQLERDWGRLEQKEVLTQRYQKYIQYAKVIGSDEEVMAKILSEIEGLASEAAINLIDVKPSPAKKIDFYNQYTIEVKAEGDMTSIVTFLYKLNVSTQLLRAEKVRFTSKERNSPLVKANLIITKVLVP
jgi:Tfp pilus assembly protein PilO